MGYIYNDEDNVPMCDSCINYNHALGACMREWNNLDSAYYVPDRDGMEPDEKCDEWEGGEEG